MKICQNTKFPQALMVRMKGRLASALCHMNYMQIYHRNTSGTLQFVAMHKFFSAFVLLKIFVLFNGVSLALSVTIAVTDPNSPKHSRNTGFKGFKIIWIKKCQHISNVHELKPMHSLYFLIVFLGFFYFCLVLFHICWVKTFLVFI